MITLLRAWNFQNHFPAKFFSYFCDMIDRFLVWPQSLTGDISFDCKQWFGVNIFEEYENRLPRLLRSKTFNSPELEPKKLKSNQKNWPLSLLWKLQENNYELQIILTPSCGIE